MDALLTRRIYPAVQSFETQQWISGFFFVRYRDRQGIHIRLRMQGRPSVLREHVKPALIEQFKGYTLRFPRYTPEYGRYGGADAMAIAHRQFEVSSRAVLEALTVHKQSEWSQQFAIGCALRLHTGLLAASTLGGEASCGLLRHIAGQTQAVPNALPALGALWQHVTRNGTFEDRWYQQWVDEVRTVAAQLETCVIEQPRRPHAGLSDMQLLYESYIHMTNNRLGIPNKLEPIVAAICAASLQEHVYAKPVS